MRQNTKNLIKISKFLFCFSRFARALIYIFFDNKLIIKELVKHETKFKFFTDKNLLKIDFQNLRIS